MKLNKFKNRYKNLSDDSVVRILLATEKRDVLTERAKRKGLIDASAEDGSVAIVYGGRDCDGCQWDDRVRILQANVQQVEAWVRDYMSCAEGPQWWHLCKPSQAPETPHFRDLVAEAHEDGHPHVIYA